MGVPDQIRPVQPLSAVAVGLSEQGGFVSGDSARRIQEGIYTHVFLREADVAVAGSHSPDQVELAPGGVALGAECQKQ